MDDISAAILDSWAEIGPRVLKDPIELAKRLARRRLKSYGPMRGWCVALRASDTRINPGTAMCYPPAAAYPRDCLGHDQLVKYHYGDHEVTLTSELVRKICRPVMLSEYGNTVAEVTQMLGLPRTGVEYAIKRGVFRVEWHPRYSNNRKIRVLLSPAQFDPSCSSLKQRSDPVWQALWPYHADRVPEDFEQTIVRSPERHGMRETFLGWRWICPGCARRVRTMFYPLKADNLSEYYNVAVAKNELDEIRTPAPTFACVRCHNVRYFNRIGPNPWNELIFHMSGGLLYGFEVPRPEWLTPERKKRRTVQLNRAPSKRRAEVYERLLKGWTYRQIAQDIGSGYATVHACVEEIYKQNRVHSRAELIERHRKLAADGARMDAGQR